MVVACCETPEVLEWDPSEDVGLATADLEFLDGQHREKMVTDVVGRTFVARPVGKVERLTSKRAQAALRKEWDRLRAIKCWDESAVRGSRDVEEEARRKGTVVHIARIFAICHEKRRIA